jgi:hypothetical protein
MVLAEEDPTDGNKFSNKTSSTLIREYLAKIQISKTSDIK